MVHKHCEQNNERSQTQVHINATPQAINSVAG